MLLYVHAYIYILSRQGAYYWHKFHHHMKTPHTFYTRIKLYSLMGNLKKCMHVWCVLPYFIHSFSTNLTSFLCSKCVVWKSVSVFFSLVCAVSFHNNDNATTKLCVSLVCWKSSGISHNFKTFFLQNTNKFYISKC